MPDLTTILTICRLTSQEVAVVKASKMKMFRRGYGAALLAIVAASVVSPSSAFNTKGKCFEINHDGMSSRVGGKNDARKDSVCA